MNSRPSDRPTPAPALLRLAWWGTAWLRGQVVTDLALDGVIGPDATHVIAAATLGGGDAAEGLATGLGRLRAEGVTRLGAAYPAAGDPVGLGGPIDFNQAALEAGRALVGDAGIGLIPHRVGAAVTWQVLPAQPRHLPDLGEADRGLRTALLDAADTLAGLDVARWRPEVADVLMNLRHRPHFEAPPGVPERCLDLAARALQARRIVALALDEDGVLSAHEASARREALSPLDRAARRALSAAGSPETWPEA